MTDGLFLPKRVLAQASNTIGTPILVYDEAGLREAVARMRAAFAWNDGFSLFFPVWMAPEAAVLRILLDCGCGAECGSAAELRLAARCGFSGELLRYAPGLVDAEGEALAERLGAEFVIDDPALRPGFVPRRVILRVYPGGKLLWRGKVAAQSERSRFGMAERDVSLLAGYYLEQGAQVGLGMALAENVCEAELYPAEALALRKWIERLETELGHRLMRCDLGSGPGIARRAGDPDPDPAAIGAMVREAAGSEQLVFSASPGMWLIGRQAVLLAQVVACKERERPLVILNVDTRTLNRPNCKTAELRVLGRSGEDVRQLRLYELAGCGPEARARIAERCVLPKLAVGDLVVLDAMGAQSIPGSLPAFIWGADRQLYRAEADAPFLVRAW